MAGTPHRHDRFDLRVPDGPRESSFDILVYLVAETLSAPASLLTFVDDTRERQQFRARTGLPEPWSSRGETPLSHSFRKIVRDTERMLLVKNAREDARVAGNPAIEDLGVVSYLGVPVCRPANNPVGANGAGRFTNG